MWHLQGAEEGLNKMLNSNAEASHPKSHAARVLHLANQPVHYLYGKDRNGKDCHFFIMCPQHRYSLLEKHFRDGTVNMTDYGRVVASGYGHAPSQATLRMLKEQYNYAFPSAQS